MGFWDGATQGLDKGTAMGFKKAEINESNRRFDENMAMANKRLGMDEKRLAMAENADNRAAESHEEDMWAKGVAKKQYEGARALAQTGGDPVKMAQVMSDYAPDGNQYQASVDKKGNVVFQGFSYDDKGAMVPSGTNLSFKDSDSAVAGLWGVVGDPKQFLTYALANKDREDKFQDFKSRFAVQQEGAMQVVNAKHENNLNTPTPVSKDVGGKVVFGSQDKRTGAFTEASAMGKTMTPTQQAVANAKGVETTAKQIKSFESSLQHVAKQLVGTGNSGLAELGILLNGGSIEDLTPQQQQGIIQKVSGLYQSGNELEKKLAGQYLQLTSMWQKARFPQTKPQRAGGPTMVKTNTSSPASWKNWE
ncbi:hypothetical protein SYK_02960 [Pseudodesulfovibrio nedwellii]|uniref:Uncharacterized protein n=1 Tax=Pseudodesulfovibrio nedwellii TaxID=2973072 RepID=A0ABM8AXE1_9BACT|nr:hypothetical protein [Pseudodesulfovibrio nedwellii]BDQ35936.1 hypothetical protein SYK_02960 [Pseudodesulfovibrio nedwellii]